MDIREIGEIASRIRTQVGKAIIGQTDTVDLMLVSLFSSGHILLEGPPGTAKTLLAQSFSAAISMAFGRIQFTPDLMPGDVLGTNLFNFQTNEFQLTKGPIFTDILLADEINRTPPKTQAALLEAMQERKVTIDGDTYGLNERFMVIATQNPLEQQGTYPLPEAQLDRFLMQVDVNYPDLESERRMLLSTTGETVAEARAAMTVEDLMAAQRLVRRVPVGEKVVNAILELVRAARPEEGASDEVERHVAWGPGPRASQALMLAVRARALIDGRFSPSIEDVTALAAPVLRHRMALNFSARAEGVTVSGVIDRLCRNLG